ncbi:MAG: insulinase family protein [Fibrobacteres bacterium]|nr:insulinase family protein [Fibrobacterota bacterium]
MIIRVTLTALLLIGVVFSADDIIKPREHILKNGMKIILIEDRNSPLVVCRLYYKVGSVNETIGKSGISHMLEHMMFKGTKKIGVADTLKSAALEKIIDSLYRKSDSLFAAGDTSGFAKIKTSAKAVADSQRSFHKNNELWNLYQKEGGTALNAWTGDDMTAYIVTLPSNKLELFLWLESDRMANPVMREFYTERDVVIEERRLRYENSPYGRYYETLFSTFFEAHPYRIPTIGYMSDLQQLKRDDAFNHFRTYYAPNNSFLVLIGDFKSDSAIAAVERYFSPIPKGPTLPQVVTKEPEQIGTKKIEVKKDASPVVSFVYKAPLLGDPDIYSIDLASSILSGKSGRLWRTLVDKKGLCSSVSASFGLQRYASYFFIQAELTENASHDEVEKVILEEIKLLSVAPVSTRELEKVKNIAESDNINGLRNNENLADKIAWAENTADSWRFLNEYLGKIQSVTPDELKKAASKWLTEKNLTEGRVIRIKETGSSK